MLILKFGSGASFSAESLLKLAGIVKARTPRLVVVSAMAQAKDDLLSLAQAAVSGSVQGKKLAILHSRYLEIASGIAAQRAGPAAEIDLSFAELKDLLVKVKSAGSLTRGMLDAITFRADWLAARMVYSLLEQQGCAVEFVDAKWLILTDSSFGSAHWVEGETRARCERLLGNGELTYIVPGNLAADAEGATTTFGKSGADHTASILSACLKPTELHVYSDSQGMMTADPRLVPDAFEIAEISYAEALEMTHFGASEAFNPAAFQPAMKMKIPLRISSFTNPETPGTRIIDTARHSAYPVRGVASIPQIALISISGPGMPGVTGIAGRMFSALARAEVNVILITQASSELSICCAVSPESAFKGAGALQSEFSAEIVAGLIDAPVVERDMSVIAIVGEEMKRRTGISGRVFSALGRNGVNVVAIAQGSSELNISAVVDSKDRAKALVTIHDAFFLAGIRTVNLFLAGTGLIGGTLLSQIALQRGKLLREHSIRINLIGLANQRTMTIAPEGIDPDSWRQKLAAGEMADLSRFIDKMKRLNLPSVCFCDCTASEILPRRYEEIFASSISIVTPNKRGNAGPLERFTRLKELVKEKDLVYGYETTVGAGLPVIGTLHDLVASGDTISSIEAVLSGTLSYLFNELGTGTRKFSELVLDAKARGYTEPDPRDDLGAVDVARKMLILIREAGLDLGYEDIQIQPLLTKKIAQASRIDAFLEMLPEMDSYYDDLVRDAASRGKVLRYVASIQPHSATLRLKEYSSESPFYNLNGTDNLVMFSTARYSSNPLVVRGPGAGAEVTAGGVFADILKTAHSYL